jgi:hypothetical protein
MAGNHYAVAFLARADPPVFAQLRAIRSWHPCVSPAHRWAMHTHWADVGRGAAGLGAAMGDPPVLTIPPDARARTAHTADAAQARLFEALLQSEVQELEQLAASAERHWRRRCEGRLDEDPKPRRRWCSSGGGSLKWRVCWTRCGPDSRSVEFCSPRFKLTASTHRSRRPRGRSRRSPLARIPVHAVRRRPAPPCCRALR